MKVLKISGTLDCFQQLLKIAQETVEVEAEDV